ncbi:glycosyl transferase group 2 family protein [Gottschalkia acidurici 9a]|uniref:Glycosyl transferase group 2 family protein n=1 Tax=Gottschalkia acidurici (strain ATCC 7906 / DSM 604 / BCRC 14475 / CIP 104303 / KCTC 5404 / NCIMB 10678 / 9a) TaxID=1128398 RepID=K0AVD6_GOTA9|nr:glycosyltransferase family 2 protein [Gottschalkia acidurici]AFS77813.1 glycosyl transferase group 2 family protein [Gottschalkia acidurici 9a]
MAEISLCMIVKNEEAVLSRCLDSVLNIVDEIIIVDTGSTDNTKKIAKQYTDKVYDFEWVDDFSKARNFSFSLATKDYIIWLDADDVIMEEDAIKLIEFKKSLLSNYDLVSMNYDVGFDENGNLTLSYYRERIFKRIMNYQWVEPVHEVIPLQGNIYYLDASITHKKEHVNEEGRNIRIYENILAKGESLSTRGTYYYARELYYNKRYEDAIKYFNDFLDSNKGWIEDCINACEMISHCYSQLKDEKSSLKSLFRSFEYEVPRSNICCEIGKYYFNREDYNSAIFWYKLAIQQKSTLQKSGFVYHDYYGYIPNIQLCVCYHRLGNIGEAIKYNEIAGTYKPNDRAFLYNKDYFSKNE